MYLKVRVTPTDVVIFIMLEIKLDFFVVVDDIFDRLQVGI